MIVKVLIAAAAIPVLASAQPGTLATELGNIDRFSSLVSNAGTADLVSTLNSGAVNLAVLAPNDDAFGAFLTSDGVTAADLTANDAVCLEDVLLTHVYDQSIASVGDFGDFDSAPRTMANGYVLQNGYAQAVDDSEDNIVSNGKFYELTSVINPSIAGTATSYGVFVTLLDIATSLGLVPILNNPCAELTVFAPTDTAFTDFLASPFAADFLNKLDASESSYYSTLLNQVVTHHVVGAVVNSSDLIAQGSATSLAGLELTLDETTLELDGAELNTMLLDIKAGLGLIHVVNDVILDAQLNSTIVDVAAATPALSNLVAALSAAGLVTPFTDLADGDEAWTVFAPTNAAFDAAAFSLGFENAAALVEAAGESEELLGTLTTILGAHVVVGAVTSDDVGGISEFTALSGEVIPLSSVTLSSTLDIYTKNGVVHLLDAVIIPPSLAASAPEPSSASFPTANAVIVATLVVLKFAMM